VKAQSSRTAAINSGPAESHRHVLVIRPDALGEYILFSGMIAPLREKYADARLTFLCTPTVAELAMRNPAWDAVIVWDHVQAMLNRSYEQSVFYPLLSQTWQTVLYPVTSRETRFDKLMASLTARYKIGVEGDQTFQSEEETKKGNLVYTRLLISPKSHKSERDRNIAMAFELGLAIGCGLEPDLCIDAADNRIAQKMVEGLEAPPIMIFPGPGGAIRAWGGYRFAQVVKWLREYTPYPVWLCGPKRDALEADAITCVAGDLEGVENHCGKYSIPILAAILQRSKLVIGGECGPLHLAAAVGTPNLVIMGGGQYGRFFPWSDTTRIVQSETRCECGWICKSPKPECLAALSSETVIAALEDMLGALPAHSGKPKMA
jgi:ADP-heptose:LPS heptosyltransferase